MLSPDQWKTVRHLTDWLDRERGRRYTRYTDWNRPVDDVATGQWL